MAKSKPSDRQPAVLMDSEVVRQIRQHARSCSKTEVCGVLIGTDRGRTTLVEAAIAGLNAAQAGTHVTFTQDTWEHIYKTKDKDYPDARIVGWYHSHPGFGVFLSDHDTFIHKNFFSSPQQIAWVYDPHSDEEGCFGWAGERLERLSEMSVTDRKGGEEAGETGKPEPVGAAQDDDDDIERIDSSMLDRDTEPPAWLRWTVTITSHLSLLALGFMVAYFLFPRPVLVPVPFDPTTGRPLLQFMPPELRQRLGLDTPAASDAADPNADGSKNGKATPDASGKDKNAPR
jgi:proteasome lid subunit RPN8/RPN11